MEDHIDRFKKDAILYKFNEKSKTALKVIKKHPPNKKQRQICDRLLVPHLLWSFFEGKILKYDKCDLAYILYPLKIDEIKMHEKFDFNDMELSDDEKIFISHHEALEKIRQNAICYLSVPASLLELCMQAVVKQTDLRGLEDGKWESLLPKELCQKLSIYKRDVLNKLPCRAKTPKRKIERVHFFDLPSIIDLFKEEGRKFSEDFIDWFKKDESICFEQFKDSHKLILITLYAKDIFGYHTDFLLCLECIKHQLRGCRIVEHCSRRYKIEDITVLNSIENRNYYWCRICKEVPIFQILSLSDLCEQYGTKTKKIELFI